MRLVVDLKFIQALKLLLEGEFLATLMTGLP